LGLDATDADAAFGAGLASEEVWALDSGLDEAAEGKADFKEDASLL
jgi:hypothetical protein